MRPCAFLKAWRAASPVSLRRHLRLDSTRELRKAEHSLVVQRAIRLPLRRLRSAESRISRGRKKDLATFRVAFVIFFSALLSSRARNKRIRVATRGRRSGFHFRRCVICRGLIDRRVEKYSLSRSHLFLFPASLPFSLSLSRLYSFSFIDSLANSAIDCSSPPKMSRALRFDSIRFDSIAKLTETLLKRGMNNRCEASPLIPER